METIKCKACGSNDIIIQDDYCVCRYCGTKSILDRQAKLISEKKNSISQNKNAVNAISILNDEEDRRVVEAIKQAELNTSGEIKVHIENRCKGNVEERSLYVFDKLKLHETKLRNGVLIYLAVRDHKFAILGDEGINKVVGDGFWNDVKDLMQAHFKEGRFAEGLEQGIQRCGEKLKTYFPYQSDDINEIPDEISYEIN